MKTALILLLVLGLSFFLPSIASANHAWNGYHWARTANPFSLKVGDNLSANWDPILATSILDWNYSSVLDLVSTVGGGSKNCRPTAGRVEVCNAKYGRNGWLGIAQIWTSGLHITQGVVKANDTYFNTPTYNTIAWKNMVLCQEIGHTLGLDHQDEDFSNPTLSTCMDYTSDPTPNQHPNQHDYDELEAIYAHLDAVSTISNLSVTSPADLNSRAEWGKAIKDNGRLAVFERNLGLGQKLHTFVIWGE
jgi:hypothetical protein